MARLSALCLLSLISSALCYDVLREYKGDTFFNDVNGKSLWTWFSNWDNLTLGDVWYLDQPSAFDQRLAYTTPGGQAVIRVDNTSNVAYNQKRNSVRITTQDTYDVGTLWITDMNHVPWGCSVWPAYWSVGAVWPDDGEIDIMEAINLQSANQMALHTTGGCNHTTPAGDQKGTSQGADCSTPAGCVVTETAPNSFANGFHTAGGGVWATQFDVSGIYIWFWSRPDIPASVTGATSTSSIDISQWGPPSASFPANPSCNITNHFGPQNIIFNIALCGDWAGIPSTFASTGCSGQCYPDYVVGDGAKYDEAYFEVNYLRVYSTGTPSPATTIATSTGTSNPSVTPTSLSNTNNGASGGGDSKPSNAGVAAEVGFWLFSTLLLTLGLVL